MEDKLIYFDLCGALSDIFVDSEVDFKYIVPIAKYFLFDQVEDLLFEWVAPVCYTNLLTSVPSILSGFDKQTLWIDICECQKKFLTKYKHRFLVFILKNNLQGRMVDAET